MQNPWWEDPPSIDADEKVRQFDASAVKWPLTLPDKQGAILVLRGPRQVGKTTAVKLKIRFLLRERKVVPQAVCYLACDLINSAEKLYGFLLEYDSFSRLFAAKERFLFVDEATFVRDWPLALKRMKDSGRLSDCHVLVTGSNSADLKKGSERLPGRGIEGNEYFLCPLSFSQYMQARTGKPFLRLKTPFELFEGKTVSRPAFAELQKREPAMHELGLLFDKFLRTGGFLKAVNEFEKGLQPVHETYLRWIERDLSAFGRDSRTAQQVLRAVIEKRGSPASMLSLARQTDLASHKSVKDYLGLLEDLQVLSQYACFDLSSGRPVQRRDKKIHFLDPFIASACGRWTSSLLREPEVVEGVVAEAFRRTAAQNNMQVGYYRDKSGEVDVVLAKGGVLLPVEVKWQEKLSASDFKPLYKFGFGILATKASLKVHREKYLAVPVSMLAASLAHESLQRLYG